MSKKSRVPLQVSPEFRDELDKVKKKVLAQGKEMSLRQLTKELINTSAFTELEERLLKGDFKADIKIKFDTRGIWDR